jgi:tetratricopeptide (TPR) repeat protein
MAPALKRIGLIALLALAGLSALILPARAQGDAWTVLFAQANQLYEQGRYAEAAARYEEIVAGGIADGRVYYNLGNAYFKAGQIGKAILNYERARRLLPRDDDIRANLSFAQAQVQGGPKLPAAGALSERIGRLVAGSTPNELAWIAWGMYLVVVGLGLLALLSARARRPALIAAAVAGSLLIAALAGLGAGVYDQEIVDHAVVVAGPAPVYSGPGQSYMLEITLGEGSEVVLEERRGEWCRLRLAGDLQGWAACESIESVRPAPR